VWLSNVNIQAQLPKHHNYRRTIPNKQDLIFMFNLRSRGTRQSAVGIATGYELDDRGVGLPSAGKGKNFLFSTSPRPALESTQTPIEWVPGLFPGGKVTGA
jgi:hypothetical protein